MHDDQSVKETWQVVFSTRVAKLEPSRHSAGEVGRERRQEEQKRFRVRLAELPEE